MSCEHNDAEYEYTHDTMVCIDQPAPTFYLPAYNPTTDSEETVDLEEYAGRWKVLFFYPADFTFVCPTELKDMADAKSEFDELDVDVFAISTDTIYSHRAWTRHEKLMENFPYRMLSDHALDTAYFYDVLDHETGIAARGTFIIDPENIVRGIEITSGPLGRNSDELIRKIRALQYMEQNP